jgi:hypothetical protein
MDVKRGNVPYEHHGWELWITIEADAMETNCLIERVGQQLAAVNN